MLEIKSIEINEKYPDSLKIIIQEGENLLSLEKIAPKDEEAISLLLREYEKAGLTQGLALKILNEDYKKIHKFGVYLLNKDSNYKKEMILTLSIKEIDIKEYLKFILDNYYEEESELKKENIIEFFNKYFNSKKPIFEFTQLAGNNLNAYFPIIMAQISNYTYSKTGDLKTQFFANSKKSHKLFYKRYFSKGKSSTISTDKFYLKLKGFDTLLDSNITIFQNLHKQTQVNFFYEVFNQYKFSNKKTNTIKKIWNIVTPTKHENNIGKYN